MKSIILACTASGLALAGGAHAASFDCAKAATPMEKVICTSPDLSRADDALAAAFHKALGALSSTGQTALRANERDFLAYAAETCRRGQDIDGDCLSGLFSERTDTLGHAVTHLGGWTFVALTSRRAGHSLTVQQIDSTGETARDWNAWAQSQIDTAYRLTGEISKDGTPVLDSSVIVVMHIVGASPDLIGVTVDSSTSEDAMGEIDNRYSAATWLTRPRRELMAKDLFDPTKPWATALAPVAQRHLEGSDGEPDTRHTIKRIDQAGGQWQVTAKGLRLTYDDWRSAGNGPGAESDLPWDELKPYLRKDLPFAPAKIETAPDA